MPRLDGIRMLTRAPAGDDPSAALVGRDHDEADDDRLPGQGRREDWATPRRGACRPRGHRRWSTGCVNAAALATAW